MTGVLQDVDTNTGKLSLTRPGGYPSVGNRLSSLDHNGASAAPTVADAGGTEARAVLLEYGEQRDDYARAAAADGVADGDGAPVDVDLCLVEAEQLVVGEGDDREGLVDLEVVDLRQRDARVCRGLGQRGARRGGEPRRLLLGVAVPLDCGEDGAAVPLRRGARHEEHGRRAVGDSGSVGGGNRAVLLEGGSRARRRPRRRLRLLVRRHLDVALAPRHYHRLHLLGEAPLRLRGAGASVRLVGVRVLRRAVDGVRLGAQLSVAAHVAVAVRVPQPVAHHRVHHLGVAHPRAEARLRNEVGHV
mmetsp:Transcript_5764/g.13405  ORF Transcript_5764/g.13405 Transcript_5764/m.13405 type:complete len:302 (+) Transcript_5764:88-993(+)